MHISHVDGLDRRFGLGHGAGDFGFVDGGDGRLGRCDRFAVHGRHDLGLVHHRLDPRSCPFGHTADYGARLGIVHHLAILTTAPPLAATHRTTLPVGRPAPFLPPRTLLP